MKKNRFIKCVPLIIEILSIFLVFLSGSIYSDSKEEKISDYAASVALKQSSGEIFSINVGNSNNCNKLLPVNQELYNLYGIFKQEKITFASSINSTKQDHIITIEDQEGINLSILYVGATGSDKYIYGHKRFKHHVFPVELMFEDDRSKASEVSEYICYVSKSQATRLLNKNNGYPDDYDEYSNDDYESLLYTSLDISIDENKQSFSIINIYFEDNYYCSGLNHVMGDFIMCSYYIPLNLRSEQKSMYFMSKYSYQNRYFMKYINKVYSSDGFVTSVNSYNITGEFNEKLLISFYKMPKTDDALSFIIACLSAAISLFGMFLIYKFKMKYVLLYMTCSYLVSFIVFRIAFAISKEVLWFSSFSCRAFVLFYLLVFVLFFIVKLFNRKNKKTIRTSGKNWYEISI